MSIRDWGVYGGSIGIKVGRKVMKVEGIVYFRCIIFFWGWGFVFRGSCGEWKV